MPPAPQPGDPTRKAEIVAALTRLSTVLRHTQRHLDTYIDQLRESDAPPVDDPQRETSHPSDPRRRVETS